MRVSGGVRCCSSGIDGGHGFWGLDAGPHRGGVRGDCGIDVGAGGAISPAVSGVGGTWGVSRDGNRGDRGYIVRGRLWMRSGMAFVLAGSKGVYGVWAAIGIIAGVTARIVAGERAIDRNSGLYTFVLLAVTSGLGLWLGNWLAITIRF
ncbi:MAG: hypothetical protein HC894_21230 [Microcoleus sp. SM1_3_4]|nr:hypothetical protein [Microcoleus sp. SM1_3_4]